MNYRGPLHSFLTLPLALASICLSTAAGAELRNLEAPAGFRKDAVTAAFKGTGRLKPWVRISDSHVALLALDLRSIPDCYKRVGKRYEKNLKKYSERTSEISLIIRSFNEWLQRAGVDSLAHSLQKGPVQMVIDPMCDQTETNGHFGYDFLEPQTPSWWVEFTMEPKKDLDFHFGHTPVVIHELGHFLFHTSLSKIMSPLKEETFHSYLLAPMDEGFADFVSYAFTGETVVGRRYDYSQKRMVNFRRALSTATDVRQQIRTGLATYATPSADAHLAGEPFRDVLIEISNDYGNEAAFTAMRSILEQLFQEHRIIFEQVLDDASLNIHFNHAIAQVLAHYPKLSP